MFCFGPGLQITVGPGYDGVCCDLTHWLWAILPSPVSSPPSRSVSEADSFEFGTQDLQTSWRIPLLENISGYGRFQGSHWGAGPCTLSSLDTSAPFSFLAPCCHVCTGLGQEKKEAKSCFYPPALHQEAEAICD